MSVRSVLTVLVALLTLATWSSADPLITYNVGLSPAVKELLGYPVETYLDFDQLVNRNGYISERHYVTTEDGYILTVFRMRDPTCTSYHKVPVLLLHGLLVNSDLYLIAGEEIGLGYLLAKSCFDVWASNFRGTSYSRNHTTLNPDKDAAFWDFSQDEYGHYDIPASIDYVIGATSSDKINCIGYASGASSLILSLIDRPEYNSKIGLYIGIAPAIIIKNIRAVPVRIIFLLSYALQDFLAELGIKEILFKGSLLQTAIEFLCHFDTMKPVCAAITAAFDTYHAGSVPEDLYTRLFSKLLMGQSVRLGAGFQQWLNSGTVSKYDYGTEKNLVVYGSQTPPVYDLNKFEAPAVLITGLDDGAVRWDNVQELGRLLPNVIETVTVNDTNWNHLDYMISKEVPQLMYPIIENYLIKYDD